MKELIKTFKQSIQEAGNLLDLTPMQIFVMLTFALLCGLIIYCVYRFFYRGAVYSENFNLLLIMNTLITTFIIMTISANIVLSLGMVGSLSIIRFRSAVKDPLDVGFLFWSVAVGITCGAGLYTISLLCTLFIAAIYVISVLLRGKNKRFLLVIKYSQDCKKNVSEAIRPVKYTLKNKIVTKTDIELTLQVRHDDACKKAVGALQEIDGVSSAMLVEFTGDN